MSNEFLARVAKCPSRSRAQRRYESPRRRQQAAATRTQILESARRLFEEQGYAATTMAAIAADAGVALKTVYVAFETKSGVLRAVWHLPLRGDEDDVAVQDRRWYQEVIEEADPVRQLRLTARNSRAVKERVGGLFGVIQQRRPRRSGDRGALEPHRERLLRQPALDRARAWTRRVRCGPGSASIARPTSSGRSTTQTSGSCSSGSAGGRRRSSSSGSAISPVRSC